MARHQIDDPKHEFDRYIKLDTEDEAHDEIRAMGWAKLEHGSDNYIAIGQAVLDLMRKHDGRPVIVSNLLGLGETDRLVLDVLEGEEQRGGAQRIIEERLVQVSTEADLEKFNEDTGLEPKDLIGDYWILVHDRLFKMRDALLINPDYGIPQTEVEELSC